MAHRERVKKENQDKYRHLAVFPCKLKVLPQHIFNSRDPIICGIIVEDGFVRLGTPICVPSKEVGLYSKRKKNSKNLKFSLLNLVELLVLN